MRICVLDLGGLSFHLLHARMVPSGLLRLDGLRLPTVMGRQTLQTGLLDAASWDCGMRDLAVLHDEVRALAPDRIVAVGTSCLRAAANAQAFVAAAKERYDLQIEVLTGQEEAKLAYHGATWHLDSPWASTAVIDLGGGSCEIAVGTGASFRSSHSLDLGVLLLKEAFGLKDAIGPIKAGAMAKLVEISLEPIDRTLRESVLEELVLASGTAFAVHRFARSLWPDAVAPSTLSLLQVRMLREFVLGRHPAEFLDYDVDVQRVEVIGIAVVVLEALMSQLSFASCRISDWGLREGVALREFYARALAHPEESRRQIDGPA